MKLRNILIIVFSVGTAIILSSCDPGSYRYLTVNSIVVADGTPYIHVIETQSMGLGCCDPDESHTYVSHDYGKTWEKVQSIPGSLPAVIEDPTKVQRTICVPGDNQVCYRINGTDEIEISNDGGNSWQVDWKTPVGREEFIERNPDIKPLVDVTPDTVPFDLGIIKTGKEHVVIVAMGNQGVLIKSTGGVWERYAIPSTTKRTMQATPLPYSASNLKDAYDVLFVETALSFLLTFTVFVLLSVWAWRNLTKNRSVLSQKKILRLYYLPFVLATVGFLIFIFLMIADDFFTPYRDTQIRMYLSIFIFRPSIYQCFIPIIGLLISWLFLIAVLPGRRTAAVVALACVGYTMAFGIFVYLPFILWTFGVIPMYKIALGLSILLGITIFISGLRHEKRLAFLATE